MKVLIVDDEDAIRNLMPRYVKGHDVALAADGLEGLAAAREFQPEMIISDVEMPGMNGPDFIDAYRAENPGVKVILMSGRFWGDVAEKYPSAAKYAFLQKPFIMREFRAVFDAVTSV